MALKEQFGVYDDIIHLPHPVSKSRPRMSMHDRAAQFSPFAALTGYDAAIKETARWTDAQADLDENYKSGLDEKLMYILSRIEERPTVMITYFVKDEKKDGGSYRSAEGTIRKVDFYERVIVMEDRERIPLKDIVEIDSAILREKY
ncbi:MAG: hypothetical protein IJO55_11960 [Lachnospiraceae bacterium]|nr:hypothetical protein [Lachnospiraceae bacterium]